MSAARELRTLGVMTSHSRLVAWAFACTSALGCSTEVATTEDATALDDTVLHDATPARDLSLPEASSVIPTPDADARPDAEIDAVATDLGRDVERIAIDVIADAPPRDVVVADVQPRDVVVEAGSGPTHSYGAHRTTYTAGTIRPSGSALSLDAAAADFYDRWKARYLHRGCTAGTAYVATLGDTGRAATVSEAHGYGMLLTVYMAGHDPDAHETFDALTRYSLAHPSVHNHALLGWAQDASCRDIEGGDSATDGDLDVAYALLLADRQWGSRGALDYASLARRMIEAILRSEVHPTASTMLTGDAAQTSDDRDGTRLSDFMPDHLRAFGSASGSARWSAAVDAGYALTTTLQRDFTSSATPGVRTGLLPDFAIGINSMRPHPPSGRWLEASSDGSFSWNACRTPWRLATDYLLHGDARARNAVETMNSWARTATHDRPNQIQSGYSLDGVRLAGASAGEMAFVAPFAVAAMVDARHQAWLDGLWRLLITTPLSGSEYFGNTIRALVMVVVSGNAWAP